MGCLIVTVLLAVTVWPQFATQILTAGSKSPLLVGDGTLPNTMLAGAIAVSVQNDISFHPVASARCLNVTDGQTDRPHY